MAQSQNPPGWLDIHAHFQLPQTLEEAENSVKLFNAVKFMVTKPQAVMWDVNDILRYNDSANIRMQMLSYLPPGLENLKRTNDYGASIVAKYPHRFGLLAALPTNSPEACLEEIHRVTTDFTIPPDGFATSTTYDGVPLSDPKLEPVWRELNARKAVVHIHPAATAPPSGSLPVPVVEVAFFTTSTVVEMLYQGVFRKFPDIKFVLGHCGAAVPVLYGRLQLLGTQDWVPNPNRITRDEIKSQLGSLYVDTAATAKTGLAPAAKMCGVENCIYGADCGVPCSTENTMEENRMDVTAFEKEQGIPINTIGNNGWKLFPDAARRALAD
ncbi:hypothetical protein BGW36DRAFT_364860 [Talaromyces proteolyticus]|uniref:6-methylsalicylate decarboxylase n=1 Tax=Talaromyces proteolyticus TaxID=1131652 RepID=A0AAD4KJU4_9EURO|nr:uncharacterized protein BGW36DRAFT_364860 [Talaromyces proteolyticus]KAH8690136.1 hypothetical protein BGW36DRAFT_364860 [Talaromyces proteolyticus]